jgi:hypothetical protein
MRNIAKNSVWPAWGQLFLFFIAELLTASSVWCAETVKGTELVLAQGGKAQMPIIIYGASEETEKVAEELAGYLKRITGATFKITTGKGTEGIVLGNLTEFPNPSLAKDLEIRNNFDGKEAYVIRSEPNRLLLLGATDKGVSHAVFRLLETLGCRWFFPAKEWEVVPSIPTLKVSINETDRPAILSRAIVYGYGYFYDENGLDPRCASDYASWCRHNRVDKSMQDSFGHAWQSIIHDNRKTFEQHPEYLPLLKGKRVSLPKDTEGIQMCVSNPAVRKLAAQWVLDQFDKKPELDMVSIGPSDGVDQCQCEDCVKLGSISDRVFGLANEVGKTVAKTYPGKTVGAYAYCDYTEPPSFPLGPNVYVQLTSGFNISKLSFNELIALWSKFSKNLGIYDYYSVWLWDRDLLPGGRVGSIRYLQESIPFFIAHHATSLNAESGNNWGPHGRGYYVASKLMWNPKADVRGTLEDFYAKAFGPAGPVMKRFYERYDADNKPLICAPTLGAGFRDLEEAAKLAANRPDVQARLDHLKQYMHYMYMYDRWESETDPDKKKAVLVSAITQAWRSRYSYMNHVMALMVSWGNSTEHKEPSWTALPKVGGPWFAKDLITHRSSGPGRAGRRCRPDAGCSRPWRA